MPADRLPHPPTAADLHVFRLVHETANMIINAEMERRALINRKESRCSPFRLDCPETDTESWEARINIYRGRDGSMKSKKQAFDQWPDSHRVFSAFPREGITLVVDR